MKPRLIIIFLLIVFLPMVVLAWLGWRVVQDEQTMIQHRYTELLTAQLKEIDAVLGKVIADRELQTEQLLDRLVDEPGQINQRMRREPLFSQVFIADADGQLLYPTGKLSGAEQAFLSRTQSIWEGRELFWRPEDGIAINPVAGAFDENTAAFEPQQAEQVVAAANAPNQRGYFVTNIADYQTATNASDQQISQVTALPQQQRQQELVQQNDIPNQNIDPAAPNEVAQQIIDTSTLSRGWYVWFWGNGVNLIYWQRLADGRIIGAELDRVRLIADVVAELPDANETGGVVDNARISLADSRGETLYQWGNLQDTKGTPAPRATLTLSQPLSAWSLHYTTGDSSLSNPLQKSLLFSLGGILAALTLALAGLSTYFFRESNREIRDAAQRVNFVNQVSHELKTPLTNIRMYAEMLDGTVDEEDATARRYLGVIVSESQRLSRLIGNVLTFARGQKGKLALHRKTAAADDVIRHVVEQFGPALETAGLTVELDLQAAEPVSIDPDALERIMVNLISNVEKYAASGKRMQISSRADNGCIVVRVRDYGTGIAGADAERVFSPFHRCSDALTEGVSGTGIGLAIARELAELHGGSLELIQVDQGACFEVRLGTQQPA
jgi:signal transduction histidine kinase